MELKWISVEEKLPDVELDEYDFVLNDVLVCNENKKVFTVKSCNLYQQKDSIYKGIFTHWMPLPKAPDE